MKKITSLTAACLLAASLGASTPTDFNATIGQAQQLAVTICNFLPLPETIAAILTANASLPASAIANAVCQAVTEFKPGGPKAGQTPHIIMGDKTIEIKGQFVK